MSAVEIIGKLKKISAILILITVCAASPVRADQQFVLAVGDTMVIPCLLEIWSDQSVSCVISNPEVLMADGSGRAVIALSEGVADVYVHMTNPDTDIRYTFIVESVQHAEVPGEWTRPEEAAAGSDRAGSEADNSGSDRTEEHDVTYGSDVAEGDDRTHVSDGAESGGDHAGDDARTGSTVTGESLSSADEESDTQSEESPDGRPDLVEAYLPDPDVQDTGRTEETVPFWEDRGSGGITFEVIEDDFSGRAEKERDIDSSQNTKYRPFAYLKGDGEVTPLIVCAAGREVRWKYIGRILYIEASGAYAGPYRVSARDSRGNICYFSS